MRKTLRLVLGTFLSALVASQASDSALELPFWEEKQCKNIYPSKCPGNESIEEMARRCPGPRQFVPRKDPENICCPKYGCICNGIEDSNGVFTGTTESILKTARFEFGNCTIIRGSVVLDIPAGKDPFGLDDILSTIEEIWGYLSIEGDALTELRFENLRIIRGLHTKTFVQKKKISIATSLMVQSMHELTVLAFPKLKEISRGSVIFHSCEKLCLPLTIDFYGELFANPCDKTEERSSSNSTISKNALSCQSIYLRNNCLKKFPDLTHDPEIEQYRKNRNYLFSDEKNKFKNISGNKCAFCETEYEQGLKQLKVPTGDLVLRRCWDKTYCQILSKTVCKGPNFEACRSSNSLFTHEKSRCNVGILKAERNNFKWANTSLSHGASQFDKCCPDSCSGGCDSFSSKVPNTSSASLEPEDQYWTECSACKNDNDKNSYKNTFFLNRCVPSCKHPFRVPLLIDDGRSSDYEVQFCRESSKCKNRLIYDPEDSNCVRFCGKRFGNFISIEYDSLVSDDKSNPVCKRCEAPEHLYIQGEERITYGYNCTSGQFPEAQVVCWGLGHDKFKDLFKSSRKRVYRKSEDTVMDKLFFQTYWQEYSNCNIIDGDIRIHAGNGHQPEYDSGPEISKYEAEVCKAFRNVKYVTGIILIENWTMQTLGCFEHLKLIGGKTDTRYGLTMEEFDPLGLVVKKRGKGLNKIEYLGINVTVNAGISLQYGKPSEDVVLCHAKKEILDNFVLDDENGDKPVNKVHVGMVEEHVLKNINSLNATDKQKLTGFLEDLCENQDKCHPECGNSGCFGPSESDCRSCASFIDRTVEEAYTGGAKAGHKEIQGAYASDTNAIYRYDAFFEEVQKPNSTARIDENRFRNQRRPKCVSACPVALRFTNESTKECLPCHNECRPDEGCDGPTDEDCRSCRNFKVNYDHTSSSEIPFDIPKSRGFCTPSCETLQISTKLPPELMDLFEIKTIVRNPYFDDPNGSKKCKLSSCLKKPVSPYYDEESKEYKCDCEYIIDEEKKEVIFKGISCKDDILFEQKLKIENSDRGNATVAEYLKENCSSDFGVVISTANGIQFVRCFDKGLNVGQISGIVIGVSVFFLSIAAAFIHKTRSRAILKRQKAKDVMQHLHPESNMLLEQTGEGADPRKFVEVPRFRQDQIVFGQLLGEGNFGLVFKASLKIQETREIRAREASSTSTNRGGSTSDVPLMPRKEQVIIEIPVAAKQIKSRKKKIRDILNKCEIKDLFTVENQRERILEKVLQFGGNERMTIEQLDEKATVDSHFIFDLQILETRLNEKELFDEAASFHFLRHPHLVKVFGICEYYADPKKLAPPSPPSMVLEFALKGALDSYVNRMIFKNYKKLDEVVTIQWFYQISDAMAFLHQNNVLHRDLAARNILLTFDLKALVGDFGLAALASQSDKNAELSMNGSMQIPVLWYPYESLFSDDDTGKVYSTKSDVYSFGMLMWEVLTGCPKGRTKFFGDAIFTEVRCGYNEQVHRNMLRDRICPKTPHCNLTPSTGYDTCTNAFYNDFMKPCWSFDPNDRPDFQILKKKFDQIRGRAKEFICLNKEQGKKVSRSSTSTLRLEKQHSATSVTLSSQASQESPSHVLSPAQIQATRSFDPLEKNYVVVSKTNIPTYENQESPALRSVQPPMMPGQRQKSQVSAFHFPRQQKLSDNAQSTTSATNNHYNRGPSSSFDSPTRNAPNRLYSNATQLTNLTSSIPEASSRYQSIGSATPQNVADQSLYQNVNDDVFTSVATGTATESSALLENEEDNFYQNSPLDNNNYVAPR